MIELEQGNAHDRNQDFPHEELMDELGLSVNDLKASLQRDILTFDKKYMDAIIDGTITKQERQELITESYDIAKEIKENYGGKSDNNGAVGGILAGIFLTLGAVLGIKQIAKS